MELNKTLVKEYEVGHGDFINYDFSYTHLKAEDIDRIRAEIESKGSKAKLKSMVTGEAVNFTEKRAVLHYLLRSHPNSEVYRKYFESEGEFNLDEEIQKLKICDEEKESVDSMLETDSNFSDVINRKPGNNPIKFNTQNNPKLNEILQIKRSISKEMKKMKKFEENFDKMLGITKKPIKNIVNIGIGGSDLGPKLVNDALSFYKKRNVYFFSNVDPANFFRLNIDLEETLFIVVSKSWTTIETLENMKMILELFKSLIKINNKKDTNRPKVMRNIIEKHFIAVTAHENPTLETISLRKFAMWDFVGGRYSLWSCVGLSIVLGLGYENFQKLLQGASRADLAFFRDPLESAAGLMAIVEIFYSSTFNNKCYVPYDSHLELLYKYLQQAEMESNGKEFSRQKIVWGGVGTDVQHSFFQYLHQADQNIYLEVLLPLTSLYQQRDMKTSDDISNIVKKHHQLLVANCLAQTRALMAGKKNEEEPWRNFKGNKPSTTILYSKMTPEILGFLLATYEHKIFVEGIFWGINSFDQFGVELGKKLAMEIYEEKGELDEVTARRYSKYKEYNERQK